MTAVRTSLSPNQELTMKSMPILLALLLAIAPLPLLADDHANAHDTGHGHGPATDEVAAPATRWKADAPLAAGMQRIRVATQALAHGQHGHLDAAQIRALSAELRAAVRDMFANCKLAPEPDAALHPLLARVLAASESLDDGKAAAAVIAELESVLARYPQLFEDAAWDAPVRID